MAPAPPRAAGTAPHHDERRGGDWRGIIPADTYDWVVVFGPTTPTQLLLPDDE